MSEGKRVETSDLEVLRQELAILGNTIENLSHIVEVQSRVLALIEARIEGLVDRYSCEIGEAERPRRIQRSRVKGWRMPEGAIYVGRPSKWGNPFTYLSVPNVQFPTVALRREEAKRWFAGWLDGDISPPWMDEDRRESLLDSLEQLRGHDLVCWCPLDQPCHADVLIEMANR